MKLELVVCSPADGNDRVSKCRQQAAPSSVRSSEGGGLGLISSGRRSTGLLCGSPAVVPGRVDTCDNVNVDETKEVSTVKLELDGSGSSPASDKKW